MMMMLMKCEYIHLAQSQMWVGWRRVSVWRRKVVWRWASFPKYSCTGHLGTATRVHCFPYCLQLYQTCTCSEGVPCILGYRQQSSVCSGLELVSEEGRGLARHITGERRVSEACYRRGGFEEVYHGEEEIGNYYRGLGWD